MGDAYCVSRLQNKHINILQFPYYLLKATESFETTIKHTLYDLQTIVVYLSRTCKYYTSDPPAASPVYAYCFIIAILHKFFT